MTAYADEVFAPVDRDHALERIAGGNESEVYRTDDARYVVKLKHDLGGELAEAVAWARRMRAAAERYARCLGPRHTIPSFYVVTRDSAGRAQVLVIQPFVDGGRPLSQVDYAALGDAERAAVAAELEDIIRRALAFYGETGSMPDLYGRTSASSAERARLNAPYMLPWRLWSFIVRRNLLRSHNLMLTGDARRVVLIDYDLVRKGRLYRLVYYTVRRALFWRDRALLWWMRRGGPVPKGA
ncbi:MAG TPA: hypothetical protein VNL77_07110 [Roseiflexaceae bacterium]|nr:hypothetical protein [Roseiflexaceae bacterium]